MAGYENIKNKGFDHRSTGELREIQSRGGKKSGEARRRKANFRNTLNLLLTAKINSEEWEPILNALGVECTLESALNMAMIKEGLSGNVKAYEAIARYAGQSTATDADLEEQKARTEQLKANADKVRRSAQSDREDEEEIADDGFLEALKGTAAEDWSDEED